jgi:hypothetical protein
MIEDFMVSSLEDRCLHKFVGTSNDLARELYVLLFPFEQASRQRKDITIAAEYKSVSGYAIA